MTSKSSWSYEKNISQNPGPRENKSTGNYLGIFLI